MAALAGSAPLTSAQRQRGLATLFVNTFFSWAGFLLVVPLIAVHYVDDLGWAAGTVGLMLAIRQFGQQGTAIAFGVLADRLGPKPLIVTGLVVRGLGFGLLAYATTVPLLVAAMILAGLGGALFESPNAAAIAALVQPEDRQRTYSLLGVIGGVGMVAGTQLGAFLLQYDFRIVCLASTVGYGLMALIVGLALPRFSVSIPQAGTQIGVREVFRDRVFIRYVLLLTGFWFAWTQFQLTITLAATDITGTDRAVSWLYLVNTSIVIGLGFVLPRFLERWMRPIDLLWVGTLVLGCGLGAVGLASSTLGVLLAAAIFSVGMVLARPGQETVTANLSDPAQRGTYFGVAMLSLAVGGGFGNLLGGVIYDFGTAHDLQAATWAAFFAISAIAAFGLFLNRGAFSMVRSGNDPRPAERPAQTGDDRRAAVSG
jgi:DHA1 family multidrug resistance protein-like MFS transporter